MRPWLVAAISLLWLPALAGSDGRLKPATTYAPAQSPSSAPTFTKDVAPILYSSCVSCHRPGEAGPMSLLTYEVAQAYAPKIKAMVVSRQMPPWFADPAHGEFRNKRSL